MTADSYRDNIVSGKTIEYVNGLFGGKLIPPNKEDSRISGHESQLAGREYYWLDQSYWVVIVHGENCEKLIPIKGP